MSSYVKVDPAYWDWLEYWTDLADDIFGHMPTDFEDLLDDDERRELQALWDKIDHTEPNVELINE